MNRETVKLTDPDKARLLSYLESEYDRCKRDVYDPLMAKWTSYEERYNGRGFPKRRADWMSNIPPLLGATYTDATTARFMNTLVAYKPTFIVRTYKGSDWARIAKDVEDFVEYKVQTEMKYYEALRKSVFESCRLGTGAFLAPWVEEFEFVPYRRWGIIPATEKVPTTQGLVLKGLPIRDLKMPGGYSEVLELPWWSRIRRWTALDLEFARQDTFMESSDIDYILKFKGKTDDAKAEAQQRAGEEEPTNEVVLAEETWVKFDAEKKGRYGKYIVTWHPESKRILRVEQDEYPRWPLFLFRYGPRDYGIYGLGIMEMSKPFEDALYALINLLIDNFKISTMQVFKGRKGSGLRADTDIFPGKLILLNDPEKDLVPAVMGAPYNLNPAFVRLVTDLSERRTGISDYGLGRESPAVGSKATATATLALIQEGARRFDLCIRDTRQELDHYGNYAIRMYHTHLPKGVPYMVFGNERGASVQKWLDMPSTPPYFSIGLISNLANLTANKEVAKQDAQVTMQLISSFMMQMIQLEQMLVQSPPQMQQTLIKIRSAAADKFRAVLDAFGEPSPERFSDIFISGPPITLEGAPEPNVPGAGAPSLPGAPPGLPPGIMAPGPQGGVVQ